MEAPPVVADEVAPPCVKEFVVENEVPKKISHIQFSLVSANDVVRASEFQVVNRVLYQFPKRTPMPGGALDLRLGVSDKKSTCATCGNNLADCAGHFAHIELALPVFHVGYFKSIISVLQRICKTCSRVLLPDEERIRYAKRLRNPRLDRLQIDSIVKQITEKCKKCTMCPHCYVPNGVVKKVGTLKIVHELRGKARKDEALAEFLTKFDEAVSYNKDMKPFLLKAHDDLNPLLVQTLFRRISGEDCELLDFDPNHGRPEELILTHIWVPPVCIRPSVCMDASQGSNEDDITIKITEIMHMNEIIRNQMDKGQQIAQILEDWDFLQLQCALCINSELPGLPPNLQSAKPIRGFCQRLKGKTGRFRGNLSGKRVDFSGRTVISPDPNLGIDQVAVPELVAKILTFPERVFAGNYARMQKLIVNGPDTHPGANYVEFFSKENAGKRFLKYGDRRRMAEQLEIGDIVERHLQDDDIVLFNRQPSLHKLSIMAHKARVMPWRTFRFNECVCTPYNADFDGDEMNLHLPQTEEARAEAITLMGVVHNLVTPRNGEPLIAATQDFLTGCYLISRKDTFYDRSKFTRFCSFMDNGSSQVDLPPPAIFKPVELWTGKQLFSVLIKPNKAHSHVLVNFESKSKSFSNDWKGIPFMCPKDGYVLFHNSDLVCGVMDKTTLGSGNKLNLFHVLLRDYGPESAALCMSKTAKLCARWIGEQGFSIGIADVTPSPELFRQKKKLVDDGYAKCDQYIRSFQDGTLEVQAGCDLEQTLESKISGELNSLRDRAGTICLEQLHPLNSPLIMAVCGSKGSNINISQMVACVGQQTVSGSRIPNGFVNRTLPHFGINSKVAGAKGFVANSFFSGLTPTEFFFHTMGGREGLVDTAVKTAETGYMQRRLMKALEDLSTQYDQTVRNSTGGIVQFRYGDDGLDPAGMEAKDKPVDFARAVMHVRAAFATLGAKDKLVLSNDEMHELAQQQLALPKFADASETFVKDTLAYLRAVDHNQRMTATQVGHFVTRCFTKFRATRIEPGTAVGALGAQSIGEPGTQMTLKTFHFAGVASMNVTLDVPRIKEIINASKTISTPIITAGLVSSLDVKAARIVKGRIEKTSLGEIALSIKEVFLPGGAYISITLCQQTLSDLQLDVNASSVAVALLKEKLLKLKKEHVKVEGQFKLRILPTDVTRAGMLYNLQMFKNTLPKVIVKGISSVNRAVISSIEKEPGHFNLLVEGYDLKGVMGTPGIKGTHTTSNHIIETEQTLGIEAGRKTIMNEINYTMTSHGMTIDYRHVMLLADVMTFKGAIYGITRFGIRKMKDSVLMLASFEQTTDHLFEAAVHARTDSVDGVSECIIMGIPMPIGTGLFKLLTRVNTQRNTRPPLLLDTASKSAPL